MNKPRQDINQTTKSGVKKTASVKTKKSYDKTGTKRQQALRERKTRVEVYMTPAEYSEVEALIASGECANQADLVRQSVHEKYLHWMKKKA